jgi:hypothetical protein
MTGHACRLGGDKATMPAHLQVGYFPAAAFT